MELCAQFLLGFFLHFGHTQYLREIQMPPAVYLRGTPNWKEMIKGAAEIVREHDVHLGIKTKPVFCPENTYVWGYVLVRDTNMRDSLAFNRIDFLCHAIDDAVFSHSEAIRITPNFNITFHSPDFAAYSFEEDIRLCEVHNGPMREFRMGYQKPDFKGAFMQGVLDFQGICWNDRQLELRQNHASISGLPQLEIKGACEKGSVVCGFQLKYQLVHLQSAVVKSVVDVDLFCCKLINEVDYCNLHQKYKIVARIDNRGSAKSTKESYTVAHSITFTKSVTETNQSTWDQQRSQAVSETFMQHRIHAKALSEIDRKFDREASLFGLFQGLGDMVAGFTGFVKQGVGKIVQAVGLGELFGVGGLAKLVGEAGISNAVKLGEQGLKFHFDGTDFGKLLQTNIGPIFHNLNTIADGQRLEKMWGFYGYSSIIENAGRLVSNWHRSTHSASLSKIVGQGMNAVHEMSLRDVLGIYGLAKAYGKAVVHDMLQTGELRKVYDIGDLDKKSWAEGVGMIVDSTELGRLCNTYALAYIFGPFGIGKRIDVENLLNKAGGIELTRQVAESLFSTAQIKPEQWIDTVVIYFFVTVLGKEANLHNDLYKASNLSEVMGENGLERILSSDELSRWFTEMDGILKKTDDILKVLALVGLNPMALGVGEVIGSIQFQKSIGTFNFEQIVGSNQIIETTALQEAALFYGLKNIYGDIGPTNTSLDLEAIFASKNFGTILGLYTVGQILGLKNLEKITGNAPPSLTTLENPNTESRNILTTLGGLATAAVTGLKGVLSGAGIFSKLFGSGDAAVQPINEVTMTEKQTLDDVQIKTREDTIEEKQALSNQLVQEISQMISISATETIENTYDANTLTLVLTPIIQCDDIYSVDVSDRKTHVTILVPESANCQPEESYILVQTFDYLYVERKERRSFFMEIGTEWTVMEHYRKVPNIKEILAAADPTRGIAQKIETFKDERQGSQNVGLKKVIAADIKVQQVWKEPRVYEAEAEVWQYNYNIVVQLKLKCHEVVVRSAQPQLIRLPRVFHCQAKGMWVPVHFDRSNSSGTFASSIGLIRGGSDVNSLNDIQKSIPEVTEQILRMGGELRNLLTNPSSNATTASPDDVNWKHDASLLQNSGWNHAIPTTVTIDLNEVESTNSLVIMQLVAKCGPIEVNLDKYKLTDEVNTAYLRKIPADIILESGQNPSDGDCPPHFPC